MVEFFLNPQYMPKNFWNAKENTWNAIKRLPRPKIEEPKSKNFQNSLKFSRRILQNINKKWDTSIILTLNPHSVAPPP